MRTICASALALSVLMAAPARAESGDDQGFYMGLNIGSASLKDPSITYYDVGGTFGGTGAQDTASATLDTKSAVTFGGALGYDFGAVRSDIEVSYSRHKIDSLTFVAVNGTSRSLTTADRTDVCDYLEATTCSGSGNTFVIDGSRVRQLSVMGNLWLDIPAGKTFVPYLGGGLGIAGFEVDGEGKGKFAWQLGAGASVRLSSGTALTFDFRHRETSATRIEFDSSSGYDIGKLKTNSFTAGVRFTF